MTTQPVDRTSAAMVALSDSRTAHNYHPLPVVVAHAEGAWMTDVDGNRFLDLLAGYSALNFGHGHPDLLRVAHEQLDRLTLTSRAFIHDQFGAFCAELGDLAGKELVLPMNTGAEAVETTIKVSRKWGYDVKGVPADQAQHHRGVRQLPRPYDDHRRVLRRPRRPRRLRPVHAGLRAGSLRRPRRPRGRHRARTRWPC